MVFILYYKPLTVLSIISYIYNIKITRYYNCFYLTEIIIFLPFVIIWAHILVTEQSQVSRININQNRKMVSFSGFVSASRGIFTLGKKQKKGNGFIWRHSLC
jgi:hypothetical protein